MADTRSLADRPFIMRRCLPIRTPKSAIRNDKRSDAGDDVERDRDELRRLKAVRRHQQEVGEKTSERRAAGVHRVQHRDATAADCEIVPHEMTDQQRERAAHQQRDRRQHDEGDGDAAGVRGG